MRSARGQGIDCVYITVGGPSLSLWLLLQHAQPRMRITGTAQPQYSCIRAAIWPPYSRRAAGHALVRMAAVRELALRDGGVLLDHDWDQGPRAVWHLVSEVI